MTTAALEHGQIPNVKHSAPDNMVQFFSGLTNILFAFGSHGLCVEIMEAMWKPKNYKYAYICCVLYTYLLTIPNSVSVYWAYGDVLLHHSNAFSVLPPSAARNVAIVAMIAHQVIAALQRMIWHCFHISAAVQGPF
jgi:auxin influx carrier (AUX1 LAX family)